MINSSNIHALVLHGIESIKLVAKKEINDWKNSHFISIPQLI